MFVFETVVRKNMGTSSLYSPTARRAVGGAGITLQVHLWKPARGGVPEPAVDRGQSQEASGGEDQCVVACGELQPMAAGLRGRGVLRVSMVTGWHSDLEKLERHHGTLLGVKGFRLSHCEGFSFSLNERNPSMNSHRRLQSVAY